MKIIKVTMLTAILLAVGLPPVLSGQKKSFRQPFPETGFWVTETKLHEKSTIVKYYANSKYLVSETIEPNQLDISKLSVRKYLNSKLKKELAKDPTIKTLPKLYEMD